MANLERQRTPHKFDCTVIVNPEAQALISIIQSRQVNPDKMRVRIEGQNNHGLKYSHNVGRKTSRRLLQELSAYEGSTEIAMKVFIDKKPTKVKGQQHKVADTTRPVRRVILQEVVIQNPSQAILKQAIEKKSSLGDRVFIGEMYDRKGHVVASLEIIPKTLQTPEAFESAVNNLMQVDGVRIQDVLDF